MANAEVDPAAARRALASLRLPVAPVVFQSTLGLDGALGDEVVFLAAPTVAGAVASDSG